jgi:Fur family ferric uptake transcriptional regulator
LAKKAISDEARQRLRAAGLRATPARVAILGVLSRAKGPISHQEASERLNRAGIDKSTVLRCFQDLAQAGLVRRMELGDHVWRYESLPATSQTDHSGQSHPHLLCVECGSVTCLTDEDVELNVSKSIGAIEDVLLKGHCANCCAGK